MQWYYVISCNITSYHIISYHLYYIIVSDIIWHNIIVPFKTKMYQIYQYKLVKPAEHICFTRDILYCMPCIHIIYTLYTMSLSTAVRAPIRSRRKLHPEKLLPSPLRASIWTPGFHVHWDLNTKKNIEQLWKPTSGGTIWKIAEIMPQPQLLSPKVLTARGTWALSSTSPRKSCFKIR